MFFFDRVSSRTIFVYSEKQTTCILLIEIIQLFCPQEWVNVCVVPQDQQEASNVKENLIVLFFAL